MIRLFPCITLLSLAIHLSLQAASLSDPPQKLKAEALTKAPWPASDHLHRKLVASSSPGDAPLFLPQGNRDQRQGGEDQDSAVLLAEFPALLEGSTGGFSDDYTLVCNEGANSADVVYLLQSQISLDLELSLCSTTEIDAVLALYHAEILNDSLLECDATGCGNENGLIRVTLQAGQNYFLVIEGAAGSSGEYILKAWSPCAAATALPCEGSVVIQDSLTGNAWQEYCQTNESGPEQVWSIDFPGGLFEAELNALNSQDHDLILLSECDPASCLQMPFQSGDSETLSNILPAGSYLLVVDLWNWQQTSNPALGLDYSLDLHCDTDPCSELPLLDCSGPAELEPNGGWDDNNLFYNELSCGDTLCGTLWAANQLRDLDWFRIDHEGGPLRLSCDARLSNPILYLTDFALPAEGGTTLFSRDRNPVCAGEEINISQLAAGSYYAVISHNALLGVSTEEEYRIWLGCPEDPCEALEPPQCSGQQEVEPNEGWNSGNQNWDEWLGTNPICGTVTAQNGLRDTDWFRFELLDSSSVSLSVQVAEFDPILFLADAALPPVGVMQAGANNFIRCQAESLYVACLAPGEYYAMVAPSSTLELPAAQDYELHIRITEMASCPEPCADVEIIQSSQFPVQAQFPAPDTANQQRPWLCEEVNSNGYDDVFQLQLASAMELRIEMQAESALSDEVLLLLDQCGDAAQCMLFADDNGPGESNEILLTGTLEAGSYTLVADFWGSLESHPYSLSIESLTAISREGITQPASLALNVVPNPFNPGTRIGWDHPGGSADLRVYSILGREVRHVELPEQAASRTHWYFDGTALASGVYLVDISTAGGEHFRGKVLLLR